MYQSLTPGKIDSFLPIGKNKLGLQAFFRKLYKSPSSCRGKYYMRIKKKEFEFFSFGPALLRR